MMTPRQQKFLSEDPRLKEIMERLDCVPVETQEFKMNGKIADRVEGWVSQMELAPRTSRRVLKDESERKPWDSVDLSGIAPGTAPF